MSCLSACGRLYASERGEPGGGSYTAQQICPRGTNLPRLEQPGLFLPAPGELRLLGPRDCEPAVPGRRREGAAVILLSPSSNEWDAGGRGGHTGSTAPSSPRQPGHVEREQRGHPPCSARRAHFPRRPPALGEEGRRGGRKGE